MGEPAAMCLRSGLKATSETFGVEHESAKMSLPEEGSQNFTSARSPVGMPQERELQSIGELQGSFRSQAVASNVLSSRQARAVTRSASTIFDRSTPSMLHTRTIGSVPVIVS